jgi:predicted transcriptional regulator
VWHHLVMRTTLPLEKDVAARLAQIARRRRQPLKTVVNEALREGLASLEQPRPAGRPFHTVEEVLSRVEGETHRSCWSMRTS